LMAKGYMLFEGQSSHVKFLKMVGKLLNLRKSLLY
jgi:hypothetical protein